MNSFNERIETYKYHPFSLLLRLLMVISTIFTVGITVCLVGYILIKGIPNLTPEQFAWEYNTENVSMLPAIVNTLMMVVLVLVFAVPVSVGAAIDLVEYAKKGNKLVGIVRVTAETLSGIPSIIFGLFYLTKVSISTTTIKPQIRSFRILSSQNAARAAYRC